jgi:hypothetical protein
MLDPDTVRITINTDQQPWSVVKLTDGGGEGAGVERNHATTRKLGPPEIVQSSLGTVRVFIGHTPFTCSLFSERRDLNVVLYQ